MRCRGPLVLAICCAALAAGAGPAGAVTALQPLVDAPPASTRVPDRVLARASRMPPAAPEVVYRTSAGTPIRVSVSEGYAAGAAAVQSYVELLEALPHGSELSDLRMRIVTPAEVIRECGGEPGVLACYSQRDERMTVPGEPAVEGVTTSYVIAHEYGHHVAANRDNRPFEAIDFGPKHWASAERVCDLAIRGRVAPGDEGGGYRRNPGEAWADVYARLHYPQVPWRLTPLLQPDAAAMEAARRDVLDPWRGPVRTTLRGRFSRSGPDRRHHAITLTLDGPLRLALRGPRRADYDLRVVADGEEQGRTSARGARDRLRFGAACRERARERVAVQVLRRSGRGPYKLRVSYAG